MRLELDLELSLLLRLAAPDPGPGSGSTGSHVYFQSSPGAACEGGGGGVWSTDDDGLVRRQGKVTVKYNHKELRKRLNLEEWILERLPGGDPRAGDRCG
ncbi:hypothetical protein ACRRTK_000224 [Alexandromys fortis]